jgi:hypothetical protein
MVDMAGHITCSTLCGTTYHILTLGRQEEAGKLILFSLFSPTILSMRLLFFPIFVSFNFFPSFFIFFLSSSILLIYSFLFSFRFFRTVFLSFFPAMTIAVKGLRNKGQKGLQKKKALDRSKCELAPLWSEGCLQMDFSSVRSIRLPFTRNSLRLENGFVSGRK